MDRPNFVGKPVMAQAQTKNPRSHARAVYGSLAGLTGALLAALLFPRFMVLWTVRSP